MELFPQFLNDMTKKSSIPGLRHSPPEDDSDPVCRHSSLRHSHISNDFETSMSSSSTSHILTNMDDQKKNFIDSSYHPHQGNNSRNLSTPVFYPSQTPPVRCDCRCNKEFLSPPNHKKRLRAPPAIKSSRSLDDPVISPLPLLPGNTRTSASLDDMYENLVRGYFMPSSLQLPREQSTPECPRGITERTEIQQPSNHQCNEQTHSIPTMHLEMLPSPPNSIHSSFEDIISHLKSPRRMPPSHKTSNASNGSSNIQQPMGRASPFVKTTSQVALDVTPSGCTTLLQPDLFSAEEDMVKFLVRNDQLIGEKMSFPSSAVENSTSYQPDLQKEFFTAAEELGARTYNSIKRCTKESNASLGRFSVLPPVANNHDIPSTSVTYGDSFNLSSCNSCNTSMSGQENIDCCSLTFSAADPKSSSSVFAASPKCSGRSSYSGKCSTNKRALSNSPLSAEGIDLNLIIRMSPTSLATYLTGSRSSSSCVSPGSVGGCYGHLSARNSSSSPRSGSDSSVKRNSSHSGRTLAPIHHRHHLQITTSNSAATGTIHNQDGAFECRDNDSLETDDMLLLQAMQELEAGFIPDDTLGPLNHNTYFSEFNNLQVMPQSVAAYHSEGYIPCPVERADPLLGLVTNEYGGHESLIMPHTKALPPLPQKPPPTYDQHLARKAMLQKKNSSDSSQPSNSSSFESSEGNTGSSGTESDPKRMYECEWLECKAVFQDHEEFVNHIEKQHVDPRKADEFLCLWRTCKRLDPFNARYKLLMHMRVHSGDKPNKCTYEDCKKAFSRLENLKIHMRSHTGERPYSCMYEGCTKTFSNSSDRSKHQKTHQDMRPYSCQVPGCGKRYTDPSSLRKHSKGVHGTKKEPDRKKIKGGADDLNTKDLSDCLIVRSIKPIQRQEVHLHTGSSSDCSVGGFLISADTSRSGTTIGSSSHHASPSSHHSSPRTMGEMSEMEPTIKHDVRHGMTLFPTILNSNNSSISTHQHRLFETAGTTSNISSKGLPYVSSPENFCTAMSSTDLMKDLAPGDNTYHLGYPNTPLNQNSLVSADTKHRANLSPYTRFESGHDWHILQGFLMNIKTRVETIIILCEKTDELMSFVLE